MIYIAATSLVNHSLNGFARETGTLTPAADVISEGLCHMQERAVGRQLGDSPGLFLEKDFIVLSGREA